MALEPCALFCGIPARSGLPALAGGLVGAAMRTACGVLTPCSSVLGQVARVSHSRSRISRDVTGLASGSSQCFGMRKFLRSVDVNSSFTRAPLNSQRTTVIASMEHSEVCCLRFFCLATLCGL